MKGGYQSNLTDASQKYLIADEPGSSVSFDFETVIGSVELYYQRSKKYGLGSVFCWVDGDKDRGQRIDGYWDLQYNIVSSRLPPCSQLTPQGRSTTLRKDLKPGKHVLHCELLKDTLDPGGGKEFRIISVMSI